MDLKYRLSKFATRAWLWIAARVPSKFRYWIMIDSVAKATTGAYGNTVVPELTAMDAIKRLDPYVKA